MSFSKEALGFEFDFGFKSICVPCEGVVREEADYVEIEEINRQLSEERDRQREEDFYAELSAKDFYVGPDD